MALVIYQFSVSFANVFSIWLSLAYGFGQQHKDVIINPKLHLPSCGNGVIEHLCDYFNI